MCRNIVYLMISSVIIIHLLLSRVVLCDYETIWNVYFERPCCGKDFIKHHKDHVREFTCGKLFYRTFLLQENNDALYVGSMDRISKLRLDDISQTSCEKDHILLEPTSSDVLNCESKGKSRHFDCRNHIRVVQPMDENRLYICGTNAHNPKDHIIFTNLTHLPRSELLPGIGMGIGKCPYDPVDNSTAIYVVKGNPGNFAALYSGTNAEFTKADSVIFRADIHNMSTGRKEYNFKRTLKYDSKWLDTVEYINCGKAVYSRVARVCKKDTGGKNILSQNWVTYLKARLNCSISGEFPFYFNEIQSVYQIPTDKTKFYATFTTSTNGLVGSAVCSFDIGEIQTTFKGKFKEQASSNSAWLPVLNSKVPEPRPGTCVEETASLPDTVVNFIRSHPLMDKPVNHEHNNPVFYKRDLVFTKLAVDKIRNQLTNQEFKVHYVGTNNGRIYKIVQFIQNGQSKSKLLDIFEIAQNEAIQVIEISQKHKSLYVSTDNRIKQIDLEMCSHRYDSCFRCVKDPYCGWDHDSGTCKPYKLGLLQDVSNETNDICDSSVPKNKIIVTYGQSIHLGCFETVPEILRDQQVSWYHHSKDNGRYNVHKHIETTERGLVIVAAHEHDAGRYDCHLGGSLLCSYVITVDAHRCTAPNKGNDYQKIYADWCHEFEKYKSAMKLWEKRQTQCSTPQQNSSSNEIPKD
ncbi:CLUMA_CG013422, isoform A [Clunio marinus]|uniref:Semaphorin-2A n=1 Tax=Clunio marinus TaxID=568069 RepID=A0A1J1IK62_9DIPT|nr:CLUMA_CG013422, isoform A [Clunio marinus]